MQGWQGWLVVVGSLLIQSAVAGTPPGASERGALPPAGRAAVPTAAAVSGPAAGTDPIALVAGLPLAFTQRCGPGATAQGFHARGLGYYVGLAPDALALGLLRARTADAADASDAAPTRAAPRGADRLRLRFVGADPAAVGTGTGPLPGRTHLFNADAAGDRCTGLASFARVRYAAVYPGIDVVYYGNGGELEFDLVLAPGADPAAVRLGIDRADGLRIDAGGDLQIAIGGETLILRSPVAWQERDGVRVPVETRFALEDGDQVSLRLGDYDRSAALTIDPVLSYATYLGGTKSDYGTAVAVDGSGNVFVAGYTTSVDFPVLAPYDKALGAGDVDAFVTKLAATGKALVYSTYLGGTGVDRAVGIAVDAAGNAYVTGTTTGGFPTTTGAWQTTPAAANSFVAKLGPTGSTLLYSTYVQGVEARGIAVDAAGNAHVAGRVVTALATTPGALRSAPAGAFVLKLNATGTAALYATYLGGGGTESANALALDAQGNAYVAGSTNAAAFPVVNAFQPAKGGAADGFIAKINPAGSALLYATYLGGRLDDAINAVAVDAAGNAYVAGETYSADFPVMNAYMAQKPGARLPNSALGSAFFAKLGPAGDSLAYASYLGGEICTGTCNFANPPAQTAGDAAYGIAVDGQGHAYVSGLARSYTFPLVNSLKAAKSADAQDAAFVARIGRTGGTLLYSSLLRTGTAEAANDWTRFPAGAATGIAVDAAGAAYVTGDTDSAGNFTATTGALQTTNGGGQGAIVVKLAGTPGSLALSASAGVLEAATPVTLTATVTGVTLSGNIVFRDGPVTIGTAALSGSRATLTTTLPVGIHAITAVSPGAGKEMDSGVVGIVVDNALVCN